MTTPKPPTPYKGIPTRITLYTALALILWGYAYTTYTPTLLLILLALALTAGAILTTLHLQQKNRRKHLLPIKYSELLEDHAKYRLPPQHIKFARFKTNTKNPFATGIPHRITLDTGKAVLLQHTDFTEVLSLFHKETGTTYKINTQKSKEDKGIVVFDALTPKDLDNTTQEPQLTYRQNIEQRVHNTTQRLFPESTPNINFTWGDNDYLTTVEITGMQSDEIALPNKRKQILIQLRSNLPKGDFNTYADPYEQTIRFKRSQPLPTITAPPAQKARLIKTHDDYLKFKVYYGIGQDGKPAYWQPAKDAHMLAIGGTGGGKTIFEHGIIQQLAQAGARVWLVDGKRVEFKGYRNYPNIEILAQKIEHQIRVIKMAFDLMEERYNLIEQDKVAISDLEPVFLVIDEVKTFLASAERLYKKTKIKGMPAKPEVLDWLSDMGSLARTAKIHMVFGLQRPDAEFIGGELRDNFGARASLGQLQSNVGSMMMWNNPAIGVQVPKIPGRAVSLIDGTPGQIQVPFTANPDPQHKDFVASMVAALYPEWEIYSRKIIEDVEPRQVIDKDGELTGDTELTWDMLLNAKVIDPLSKKPVEIPVVASEESKALRASDAHDEPVAEEMLMPREMNSFDEVLTAFDNSDNLKWGASVARALMIYKRVTAEAVRTAESKAAAGYSETQHRMENTELAYDEEQEITSDQIQGGMRVTDPDTGEKIVVSDTQTVSATNQIIVTGFTEDGEEVSIEVDAHQKLECSTLLEI